MCAPGRLGIGSSSRQNRTIAIRSTNDGSAKEIPALILDHRGGGVGADAGAQRRGVACAETDGVSGATIKRVGSERTREASDILSSNIVEKSFACPATARY